MKSKATASKRMISAIKACFATFDRHRLVIADCRAHCIVSRALWGHLASKENRGCERFLDKFGFWLPPWRDLADRWRGEPMQITGLRSPSAGAPPVTWLPVNRSRQVRTFPRLLQSRASQISRPKRWRSFFSTRIRRCRIVHSAETRQATSPPISDRFANSGPLKTGIPHRSRERDPHG